MPEMSDKITSNNIYKKSDNEKRGILNFILVSW